MEWLLVFCASSALGCENPHEVEYPSEDACLQAMERLYTYSNRESFEYIFCEPVEGS